MARGQEPLPDTDEGHEKRLHAAAQRSRQVLSTPLAQDSVAPELGTNMHLSWQYNKNTEQYSHVAVRFDPVEPTLLELAAVYARPFTLKREIIYGPDIAASIKRFAKAEEHAAAADQIGRLWEDMPFTRMKTMKAVGGVEVTPPGGIDSGTVADRVLYSRIVHADDAREVLEHIDDEHQLWSLAGMVGDWLALIAHQEAWIATVRPDIISELTPWAGTQTTIFDRLSVRPERGDGTRGQKEAPPQPPDTV